MPKGIYKRTKKHREICKESRKKFSLKGYKHTEQSKKNMSLAQKNKWSELKKNEKYMEEFRKNRSEQQKKYLEENENHWLGRTHSEETKKLMKETNKGKTPSGWKMSEKQKKKIALGVAKNMVDGTYGPFNGKLFRSEWELMVAKNFSEMKLNWFYEPTFFVLPNGRTYTPDFLVEGKWVEVKGWYSSYAIEKMNLFANEMNRELFVIDERNVMSPEYYFKIKWGVI